MNKPKRSLSTTQVILLGFLLTIAAGTLFLCLPFSTVSGIAANPLDACFTAVTSTCVTGLVVQDTFSYWSIFGQAVILILIQLGGLGVVSLTTTVMLIIGRRVTLRDRLLLEDAFNLDSLSGLVRFLLRMFRITFLIEAAGALIYSAVFIPQFGFLRGVWISVFTAVSAFCNAGIDIIGADSLIPYASNPVIILTTSALIISGGLGFLVWWDISRVSRLVASGSCVPSKAFARLSLHSKIVLSMTALLLISGAAAVFVLEYNNPETLGGMGFGEKLLSAVFESVTLRTAGFAAIPQKGLTDASVLVGMLLMFIGGSPVGTAGGIKTTTAAALLIAAWSFARGKRNTSVFRRSLPADTVKKSLTVFLISVFVIFCAVILLLATQTGSFTDIAFEAVSALGTVGLTRSYTASLDSFGRIVIMICMYLGRVGPISLVIALGGKRREGYVVLPEEDIRVG